MGDLHKNSTIVRGEDAALRRVPSGTDTEFHEIAHAWKNQSVSWIFATNCLKYAINTS